MRKFFVLSAFLPTLLFVSTSAFAQNGPGRGPGDRRPGPSRPEPRRPEPRKPEPRKPAPRQAVCYAQDRFGRVFEGHGPNPGIASGVAMSECQRRSNQCRPAGCR